MKSSKFFVVLILSTFAIKVFCQPEEGLIGYWPFNSGDLTDESTNINNATLVGSPSLITDNWGNENGAYTFNGTSECVTISHSSDFNGIKTISLWFSPSNTINESNNEACGLINKRFGSGGNTKLEMKNKTLIY